MKRALFIDRDGTLIIDKHYLNNPEHIEFEKNAIAGLKLALENQYKIIIVTNQSGISHGLITSAQYTAVETRLNELLASEKITITATYFCPDLSGPNRKPNPGMLVQAAKDHDIDLANSIMIGDKVADVDAGKNAGCKLSILVLTGKGKADKHKATPDYIAQDLLSAVTFGISQ